MAEMTKEQVLQVIERYRRLFASKNIGKTEYPHDVLLEGKKPSLEHCHSMLDSMVEFVRDGKMEKVFRWLGFIQGVLWMNGIYAMTDLKNHNRPPA